MNKLSNISTKELEEELKRRGKITSPILCTTCHKWSTHLTNYSTFYTVLHCDGCLRPIEKCIC